MVNPQQPELRRSEEGSTVQGGGGMRDTPEGGLAPTSGSDKGNKGGGRGGGVPPEQQSPYPS